MKVDNKPITGINTESVKPASPAKNTPLTEGPSFLDTLKGAMPTPAAPARATNVEGRSPLKFSNHAVDRMRQRGIKYDAEQLARIENAVAKAAEKGAKETLVFTDDSAMIVAVNNNTVVTVMDKTSLKENVFTNIDSTVFV